MTRQEFVIRLAQPGDAAAAYDVCLKTGNGGQDATDLHSDPQALGNIFVGPYLRFEPALAWILDDAAGVCGYALGALDSVVFYRRYVEEWLPPLQRAHPEPTSDPATWSATERSYFEFHHPDIYFPESWRKYPSHLHIDLLPRVQGRGLGRRMMEALLAALRRQGSCGVHLGMHARNARAERFYHKLGFEELARVSAPDGGTLYLGLPLE